MLNLKDFATFKAKDICVVGVAFIPINTGYKLQFEKTSSYVWVNCVPRVLKTYERMNNLKPEAENWSKRALFETYDEIQLKSLYAVMSTETWAAASWCYGLLNRRRACKNLRIYSSLNVMIYGIIKQELSKLMKNRF